MRRKNLEVTPAASKVLNVPTYPISAILTPLKKIVTAACTDTLPFILGFFLILELLGCILCNPIHACRLIGFPMLGAFPKGSILEHHNYVEGSKSIATKQLSNSILRFCQQRKEGSPYIISFISTEGGEGKSYVTEALKKCWNSIELKAGVTTRESDFRIDSREYNLAKSITDLYTLEKEDIPIVEYPNLREANISLELLQEASLNILVACADRGWKEIDKFLSEKLSQQAGKTPLYVYLIHVSCNVVEDYTGVFPPYTLWRRMIC